MALNWLSSMLSINMSVGQACKQLKEITYTPRKLVLLHVSLLEHYKGQILIGFISDTMSLEDNNSFVLMKSENLVSKGGKLCD